MPTADPIATGPDPRYLTLLWLQSQAGQYGPTYGPPSPTWSDQQVLSFSAGGPVPPFLSSILDARMFQVPVNVQNPPIIPVYTVGPQYGSVIPEQIESVPWSISFPRNPTTGAALPNANDPILAGSRWDPFGFTIPHWSIPPWSAGIRNLLAGTASAMARSVHKRTSARNLRSRLHGMVGNLPNGSAPGVA